MAYWRSRCVTVPCAASASGSRGRNRIFRPGAADMRQIQMLHHPVAQNFDMAPSRWRFSSASRAGRETRQDRCMIHLAPTSPSATGRRSDRAETASSSELATWSVCLATGFIGPSCFVARYAGSTDLQEHAVTHLIDDDRENQETAQKHHLHVRTDLHDVHAVLHEDDEESAEHHVFDPADAAAQ